jgi:NADPH-dependent ferric siderophore reductase
VRAFEDRPERATALAPLAEPAAAFAHLRDHLTGHGIEVALLGETHARVDIEGCLMAMRVEPGRLVFDLAAPSENLMIFLKDAVAVHLAEYDTAAATTLTWSEDRAGLPANFRRLTVKSATEPLPNMRRITFCGDDLAPFLRDGLHVKVVLPADGPQRWPVLSPSGRIGWAPTAAAPRHYTLRAVRPRSGEIDIDFVRHGRGVIADWAERADTGDAIGVMGPGGGVPPPPGLRVLLGGDATALPAIARILETLGPGAEGAVVVAAAPDVERYLSAPSGVNVLQLPEDATGPVLADAMARAGRAAMVQSGWFGGEFASAQAVRAAFKGALSLGRGRQISVAYWRRGVEAFDDD